MRRAASVFDGRTDRAQFCFHFAALKTGKNLDIYPKAGSEWRAASQTRHSARRKLASMSLLFLLLNRFAWTRCSRRFLPSIRARERTTQEGKFAFRFFFCLRATVTCFSSVFRAYLEYTRLGLRLLTLKMCGRC